MTSLAHFLLLALIAPFLGVSFAYYYDCASTSLPVTALRGFLSSCSALLSPDLIKKLMLPLDSALAMTAGSVS